MRVYGLAHIVIHNGWPDEGVVKLILVVYHVTITRWMLHCHYRGLRGSRRGSVLEQKDSFICHGSVNTTVVRVRKER